MPGPIRAKRHGAHGVAWTMRIVLLVALTALAGCLSADADEPPRTIHLKMWIEDLVAQEIYPGFNANLWAFCAAAADPDDDASTAAVELWQGAECSVPGPTLRAREGDHIIVDFTNSHFHHHTIHWHGQHTPWASDGVPGSTQHPVAPGDVFRYEFDATRAGTLWYHCHVDTQLHLMQGLYGVFIIEPKSQRHEPQVDRDHVLVLGTLNRDFVEATPARLADPHADHKHSGGCGETGQPGFQNPVHDIEPDVYLLNGVSAPATILREDIRVDLTPGEKIRLRILNAGSTWESLHPHGHDLFVTHLDGLPLGKNSYWVDTLPIAPGQRIDAVLEGSKAMEGVWVFHTHVTGHVTNDGQYPGGMLTKIVYAGFEEQMVGAFSGEQVGGQAFQEAVLIPEDQALRERFELGTQTDALVEWQMPIETPCALDQIKIRAALDSPSPTLQQGNDVTVVIRDADGTEVARWALGTQRDGEGAWSGRDWPAGPATVVVTGRTVEAVLTLEAELDYDECL